LVEATLVREPASGCFPPIHHSLFNIHHFPEMSQTKHEILALLAEAGTEPRHRFGQNFMIDQNLVRIVADAGRIEPGDLVIEVGPGTGTLTDELLARVAPGGRVVAVEIDRDLAGLLRTRFAGRADFTLIEGDALAGKHQLNAELLAVLASLRVGAGRDNPKHLSACHPERSEGSLVPRSEEALRFAQGDGLKPSVFKDLPTDAGSSGFASPVKLVANLPYNIASPLVIELLIAGVGLLAFTVQKEVADRLRAPAGSDDYGPLSVMAQLLARVQVMRTLPPQAFWPAPNIDSALACLIRDDRLGPEANPFSVFVPAQDPPQGAGAGGLRFPGTIGRHGLRRPAPARDILAGAVSVTVFGERSIPGIAGDRRREQQPGYQQQHRFGKVERHRYPMETAEIRAERETAQPHRVDFRRDEDRRARSGDGRQGQQRERKGLEPRRSFSRHQSPEESRNQADRGQDELVSLECMKDPGGGVPRHGPGIGKRTE
jgi:16S rRNA A1518/A1519 N6-dimethyltransferase RsmA/KsgA/DIM1 with predicted DNA glycosylase/AP lyase activity